MRPQRRDSPGRAVSLSWLRRAGAGGGRRAAGGESDSAGEVSPLQTDSHPVSGRAGSQSSQLHTDPSLPTAVCPVRPSDRPSRTLRGGETWPARPADCRPAVIGNYLTIRASGALCERWKAGHLQSTWAHLGFFRPVKMTGDDQKRVQCPCFVIGSNEW